MTPTALTAWRTRLGWTKAKAAGELGLSLNGYAAFERGYVLGSVGCHGYRTSYPRPIPKHVALACAAVEHGIALPEETP